MQRVSLPRHHGICYDGSEDCQYKECPCPGITDFAVMGVHLKPHSVLTEMNALVDVYDQASAQFHTQVIKWRGRETDRGGERERGGGGGARTDGQTDRRKDRRI